MTPSEMRTPRGPAEASADTENSPASVAPADADAKRVATLFAALGIRGFEARELPDGAGFVCGRWGLHRHCPDLADLEAFARQVGARP